MEFSTTAATPGAGTCYVSVNNDQCAEFEYKTRKGQTYTIKTVYPSKDLTCGICFMLPIQPVFTCKQQHLYCRQCIIKVTNKKCPECREPYYKTEPAAGIKRQIESHLYHCPFKDCSFTGDKTTIESHVENESEEYLSKEIQAHYLELGSAYTFSPFLSEKQLQEQLAQLKAVNATIGNKLKRLESFERVKVIDITAFDPDKNPAVFNDINYDDLVVLVGKTLRTRLLPFKNGTFIGGTASIFYTLEGQDKCFNLKLGETEISVCETKISGNQFYLYKNKREVEYSVNEDENTTFFSNHHMSLPFYPLVFLDDSSFINITLHCKGLSEGIFGTSTKKSTMILADLKVTETNGCGAYMSHCRAVISKGNTFNTKKFLPGITSFKCTRVVDMDADT